MYNPAIKGLSVKSIDVSIFLLRCWRSILLPVTAILKQHRLACAQLVDLEYILAADSLLVEDHYRQLQARLTRVLTGGGWSQQDEQAVSVANRFKPGDTHQQLC